jgi:hypothetical protein
MQCILVCGPVHKAVCSCLEGALDLILIVSRTYDHNAGRRTLPPDQLQISWKA